jgi:hypothetical protein
LKEKDKMNSVLLLFSPFFPGTYPSEATGHSMLAADPIRLFDR